MISRREFIKLFGIGAAGIASGITTSKLLNNNSEYQYICGFIPNDEKVISSLKTYLENKIGDCAKLNLSKINQSGIKSNIISGNANKNIYSLNDIDNELFLLREKIVDKDAYYYFEANISETSFMDLFLPKEEKFIIKNHSGLYEAIDLNKDYNLIKISGEQGSTEIKINNNLVSVIKSSCKHKLCMNQHYSNNIVCVPNKVTIKREYV